ncbi:WD40-repeat-containing domain protein [Pavlovales sp. CCMP2436]|nr:WD40-repeat-containing domain protein [Pavlovales sp. CCMP2436]
MPIVEQLEPCITCHAWNGDRSMIALSPNSNDIHIYSLQPGSAGALKLTRVWTLREHDALVTGLDWAASTNRLVSSSQDRNAYVWELHNNEWKPTLVILRLQRAATSVSWSPDETKFAVGSGEKLVAVCYFEEQNNFWVSKHLRKHGSTVTCVSWSPNSLLLATGSADYRGRIVSACVRGVDTPGKQTPFGADPAFGTVLAEYASSGWVHASAWHPNGTTVAFASHDSTVAVVSLLSPEVPLQTIRLAELPLKVSARRQPSRGERTLLGTNTENAHAALPVAVPCVPRLSPSCQTAHLLALGSATRPCSSGSSRVRALTLAASRSRRAPAPPHPRSWPRR